MTRAEEFLELYKKLEASVANHYGEKKEGGSVARLGKRAEFRYLREELDYVRDVRNLLAHRPKISDDYMVEPSEGMIKLLKTIIDKVERPAIAGNIMVKMDQVLSFNKGDFVLPALRQMYDRGISFVPILNEGKVCGVFSDSIFIHCTITAKHPMEEGTMFYEIEDEIGLTSNQAVQFVFIERDTPVDELSDMIEEAEREHRKVGMIFVTEHGKESERLLGIITAWDVAAAY